MGILKTPVKKISYKKTKNSITKKWKERYREHTDTFLYSFGTVTAASLIVYLINGHPFFEDYNLHNMPEKNISSHAGIAASINTEKMNNTEKALFFSHTAEQSVRRNKGIVTAHSQRTFEKALRHTPNDKRAIYYIGLARLQNNEPKKAIGIWKHLALISSQEEDWKPLALSRIKEVSALYNLNSDSIIKINPSDNPVRK